MTAYPEYRAHPVFVAAVDEQVELWLEKRETADALHASAGPKNNRP